jgi:hypothetical protein
VPDDIDENSFSIPGRVFTRSFLPYWEEHYCCFFFSLPHCDFGALPGSFLRKERAVFCYSLALSGFDVGRLGSAKQTIGRIRRNFVLLDGWDNRNK